MDHNEISWLSDIEGHVDSPFPASFCERFQIDLDQRWGGRTRMWARPSTRRSSVRRASRETWRGGRNELALWCRRGERCGRGEVVKEGLVLWGRGGACDVGGMLCGVLKP